MSNSNTLPRPRSARHGWRTLSCSQQGAVPMSQRLDFTKAAPEASRAMRALSAYIRGSGLDPKLVALVEVRASQLNGCAFCLNMHLDEARKAGLSEQRLGLVAAWRETPLFDERERAVLAWTEAVTLVADTHVPDAVYFEARRVFGEEELAKLTLAVATINAWNRLMVAFRVPPKIEAVD